MERKRLDGCNAVGYYMDGWSEVLRHPAGFISHRYANGVVRKVWTDRDGRSGAVMWEFPENQ